MPAQVTRGTNAALLQNRTEDFDPTRGLIIHYDVRGINPSQVVALRDDCTRNGIANQLTYRQGNVTELVVQDSTQAFTQDVWQIVGTEIEVDLLMNPQITPVMSGSDLFILRQLFNAENYSWTDFVASPDYGKLSATAKANAALLQDFYNLKLSGADGYRRQQYVLKHTTNVASNYSANIADIGVDCIYTPAQLLTECQSTALWATPIYSRLSYKIAHVPQVPASTPANFQWGWLKSASTETTSPYNRIQIETDFTLEMWSTRLYTPF